MCCPLDAGDEAPPAFYRSRIVTSRKAHACNECYGTIPVGVKHECVISKWDGPVITMRTCPLCVEIRDHFACGKGWIFGEVWSNLEEYFFPDMKAGGPCMAGLSPAAKGRLFERRMQWLFDGEVERDGAPPPRRCDAQSSSPATNRFPI